MNPARSERQPDLMTALEESLRKARGRDCGCSPAWRKPKSNGTCATCGGWLPGERPAPLPFTGEA